MNALLDQVLAKQKQAFSLSPMPTLAARQASLEKMAQIIKMHQHAICTAIHHDFGQRSVTETALLEISTSLECIAYTQKNLARWMKIKKRHTSIWFKPAKNYVIPQPVGVVGIIVPWNYPLLLSIAPLVTAIAAGNRAMVKMSENATHLCQLLQRLFATEFAEDHICFIEERGATGKAFSALPLDHLLFTGSSETGKAVMRNAAAHLVPVTLELGGKSPVIVAEDADVYSAMQRILGGKTYNSGQTCVAPDYVLIPEGKVELAIEHAKAIMTMRFTDVTHPDYTSMINDAAFQRLAHTLSDASDKGATLHNLLPKSSPNVHTHQFPLHLLTNVTDDMMVMQREIFGPLLPIIPYRQLEEAIAYVNQRERPLALYIFSGDKAVQQKILNETRSGGVTINDVMLHVAQDDLPFGGIGQSGIGHYHGIEGFERLSKLRPVMYQSRWSALTYFYSPYSSWAQRGINFIINRKFGRYDRIAKK